MRARSSPAARSVYVITSSDSTSSPSSTTAVTNRSTSTAVLPVPAPAATKTVPRASIAACCCAFGARAERRHARSLRQIRHRSHQCGHSPPCGSCRTSPCRMRSTSPTAVARARVHRGVELLRLEVVAAAEPGDAVVLLAEDPARPATAADRHVDPAHRLQPELVAEHEHVERQLEEVALTDLGGRRGGARLVVEDDARGRPCGRRRRGRSSR